MSVATEEAPSLTDVERQERQLSELEARLAQLVARDAELNTAIADAIADGGEPPSRMIVERKTGRELIQDMEAALPILRQRIAERRHAAALDAARARLIGISRAAGSLADQASKDNERASKLASELAIVIERRAERSRKVEALGFEADVLAARFELPAPSLPRLASPHRDATLAEALLPLSASLPVVPRAASVEGPMALQPLADGRVRITGPIVGKRTLDGDGARILAAAGHWERTREETEATRRDALKRGDAARLAKAERVKEWVRAELAGGPTALGNLRERAKAAGIPVGGAEHGEASLNAATRALGCLSVHPLRSQPSSQIGQQTQRVPDQSVVLLALPGFDPEQFAPVPTSGPRQIGSWR
jgi:hypothetical protein